MRSFVSIESLKKAIKDPSRISKAPILAYRDIYRTVQQINTWWTTARRQDHGFDFMSRDWDTLLICDGARYDIFESTSPDEWSTNRVRSPATESWTFMKSVFSGCQFYDAVYITANPHAYKIPDGTFHAVENLLLTDWDNQVGTVRPESVAEKIQQVRTEYPNKRIIGHFMQPHFPFLGPIADELPNHGISHTGGKVGGDDETLHPWQQMRLWTDTNKIIEAYRENHSIVISVIEGLIKDLNERIAVTADHGNLIGERGPLIPMRMYGHPPDLHMGKLIEVPWVQFSGERIRAIPEPPKNTPEMKEETVESRLKSLGYI